MNDRQELSQERARKEAEWQKQHNEEAERERKRLRSKEDAERESDRLKEADWQKKHKEEAGREKQRRAHRKRDKAWRDFNNRHRDKDLDEHELQRMRDHGQFPPEHPILRRGWVSTYTTGPKGSQVQTSVTDPSQTDRRE